MDILPRCQIIPLANHQVSFTIDDREVLRWNAGSDYLRPFFFPVVAPSGALLTRMGHPGTPDHDHHQSIWFAHHKVMRIDFWSNVSGALIRQLQWLNAFRTSSGSLTKSKTKVLSFHGWQRFSRDSVCTVWIPAQASVNVHAAQHRLIEARLELVRHQQNLEFVAVKGFPDIAALQVRIRFLAGFFERFRAGFFIIHVTVKRHQRPQRIAHFFDVTVNRQLPAHGFQAAADHHHRLALTVPQRSHRQPVVSNNDLHLIEQC